MGSERIFVEHLWNRRAGIEQDYSIPAQTTFLRRINRSSDRVGGDDSGSCDITI